MRDRAREAGERRLKGALVEDDSVLVNVLRWPALACVLLGVGSGVLAASCGKPRTANRPIPVASTPVTTVITPAEAAMGNAARAEVDGRAGEALTAYESMIDADPPLPAPTRVQALMAAARLRLSADPSLHDCARARTHLLAAAAINPRLSATVPVTDLLVLIAQETEAQEQQEQRAVSIRTERALRNTVKQLQDELARAQEELAKKDDALHRATEKLLEKAPRPH